LDLGLIKYALGPYGRDLATLGAKDYFFDSDKWRKAYFENLTNVIPLDRQAGGRKALAGASQALSQGRTLLLFPEGTRSASGGMAEFRPGGGYLALEHGMDTLRVYVSGTYGALPKGRTLPTRRDLEVRIGPPLEASLLAKMVSGMRPEESARSVAL